MKLVTIIYDRSISTGITELLKKQEIAGYTKILDAQGLGGTGYKIGTSVWPGTNNILLISLSDEKVDPLVKAIREYQATFRQKPGISIFVQHVEEK